MTGNLELHDGEWRPSVPLPLFGPLHAECHCGRRFWGLRARDRYYRYQRHYRETHIPGGTA